MRRGLIGTGWLSLILCGISALAADSPGREIPEAFTPFEHMIGSWKGTGVPSANRLKGWAETHAWAWKFVKGVPVGMAVELTGDKTLAKGQLTYDEATQSYTLSGTDPAGKPVVYKGGFDKSGKIFTLDRVDETPEGKERLVLRPNANMIRYTLDFDRKETGAPQFKQMVTVGLTKEGESFAAGGSAVDLPKCIITGGAANASVSYQGKTFPICCSGCRDEFNDNPEKYVKKAALMTQAGGGKTPVKAASSSVGKGDGAFDGLGDDMPKPKAKAALKSAAKPAARPPAPAPAETDDAKAAPAPAAASKNDAKAASALRIGETLEKTGKSAQALKYYQMIVKDYPDSPQAKTAAARIKALGE